VLSAPVYLVDCDLALSQEGLLLGKLCSHKVKNITDSQSAGCKEETKVCLHSFLSFDRKYRLVLRRGCCLAVTNHMHFSVSTTPQVLQTWTSSETCWERDIM
jgi:hypothetical protein